MRVAGLILLILSVAGLPAAAEPVRIAANWPALIDAEGMRQRIATPRLRIIDLRDPAAYDAGHADGAVSVSIEAWHEAVRQGELPALIGAAGIHPSRPLLLVHQDTAVQHFAESAWVALELKKRGVASVSILEGGMAAWREAGLRLTTRVHQHRTYSEAFEPTGAVESDQNEVAGIRLGVAEGELLEVRTADRAGYDIEGVPSISIDALIGEGDGLSDPLELLDRLKATPVSWQSERVVVFSSDPQMAAAFWFLASEVLGIRGLAVMPSVGNDTSIAGLDAEGTIPPN